MGARETGAGGQGTRDRRCGSSSVHAQEHVPCGALTIDGSLDTARPAERGLPRHGEREVVSGAADEGRARGDGKRASGQDELVRRRREQRPFDGERAQEAWRGALEHRDPRENVAQHSRSDVFLQPAQLPPQPWTRSYLEGVPSATYDVQAALW